MDVTDVIGSFGKLQMQVLLIVSLRPISWSLMKMCYYFVVTPRDFYCYETSNITDLHSITPPFSNSNKTECLLSNSNETNTECTRWEYDTSDERNSLIEEWDLVCENKWMISFGFMIFSIGNFVAYMPAGQLADKYGRRPLTIFGQTCILIISIIIPLCNSMTLFLTLRGLQGFFQSLAHSAFICLFLETVGPEHRGYLTYSFSGAWGLGVVLTSCLAWMITSWRTLFWIASVPAQLPLLLGIWWFAPESSRWMLTAKKYERAKKQLMEHAKINGKTITDIDKVMTELSAKIEEDKNCDKASFYDVITSAHLRKNAAILYIAFVFTVFVSHGFSITVGTLGGSIHLNMILDGLSEVGVIALYHVIAKNLNRRYGLCLSYCIAGVAFFLVAPVFNYDHLHWLKITFAMVGKLTNSLAYVMIYIFAAELFPTNVRAVAVSGAMTAGRIGSILAPMAYMASMKFGNLTPIIIYGFLSLLTAGVIFILPETKNIQLPDTVLQTQKVKTVSAAGNNFQELQHPGQRVNHS